MQVVDITTSSPWAADQELPRIVNRSGTRHILRRDQQTGVDPSIYVRAYCGFSVRPEDSLRDAVRDCEFCLRLTERSAADEPAKRLPSLDELCLNDLLPVSRSDLPLVVSSGDEELLILTAEIVVELQDRGGAAPWCVIEKLTDDCPSLVADHGERVIEQVAKFILSSEIPTFSNFYQTLFDSFNKRYFSGALDRYQVLVVFDIHTVAHGPLYGTDGLICFEKRRIYLRCTDPDLMQRVLIHEMAHAATSGERHEQWRAEMARLKTAGAPVPGWKLEDGRRWRA
jgi:hypothetical protein